MMSLIAQKRAASGSESSRPPRSNVRGAERLDVRRRVQHREIRAQVSDVEIGRPPRRLSPIDQSGDRVTLPQHVSKVEVAVQHAVQRRRWAGRPQPDGLPPQAGPAGPVRNLPAPPAL